MPSMTPRERVLVALDHRQPDRLPMDFGGQMTTIHILAHQQLKQYLRLEGGAEEVRSLTANVAEPDPRLIERFGRDTTPFFPGSSGGWRLRLDPETNSFVDEWGITHRMPPGGYYYDVVQSPLADAETVGDLDRYRWPDPRDPARMRGVTEAVRVARDTGDKAIMISGPRLGMWAMSWLLRGFEQAYLDLAVNRKLAEALAERIMEWHLGYFELVLGEVGEYLDIVHLEGDLGSTDGPLFSPDVFRKIYKPRLARIIAFVKERTRARIYLHSCGSIYWAIPDLIECGVEVLNPIQVNARDMDPARLKREFGRELTFWGGGCDPLVLQWGTPQEVAEEVRRRIDELSGQGGFVFGSVHNIQANVPPANIVAMFETARRHGGYE